MKIDLSILWTDCINMKIETGCRAGIWQRSTHASRYAIL